MMSFNTSTPPSARCRGPADRRRRFDPPGLHGPERRRLYQRHTAGRCSPSFSLHYSGGDRLDRAVPPLARETLKLREMDYVQAATALGVGSWRIILRHILPNVMHIVLISVVLDFSGLVLAEAVLSYVGVGVDPSMISWGI